LNAATDLNSIYWLVGAAHNGSKWEAEYLSAMHDLYGD